MTKRHPKHKVLASIVIISIFVAIMIIKEPLTLRIQNILGRVLGMATQFGETHPPKKVESPTPAPVLRDDFSLDRVNNKCRGAVFDILGGDLIPVGGERFYTEDQGYSTKSTKNYQAAKETKWPCSLPFSATVVSIPISGPSFGLYVEYLDMFKVLIGDGDRKTIRVEENKWNSRKDSWPQIRDLENNKRPTLVNPIEDGEEVTLTIKAKAINGKILLHIDVFHSKFQSHEPFDFEIVPNGVNFQTDQPRPFRVGINDSRYKGYGSILDLKTLSIKEGEW